MEQPSRTIYKAGELAPETDVILKDACYNYCKWMKQQHENEIEEMNEKHGEEIELTWRRASAYYGKEIESLKAKIRELGANA